jgi:GNAT superfamily N-acetyltransferase
MAGRSSDTIEIREALPQDGPALLDVIMRINEETEFLGTAEDRPPWADQPADGLRRMRERGTGVYFLALEGGESVGFLGAFPGWVERARGIVFVAHLGLRATHRGRGIGSRLLAAIEAWTRARQGRRLELRVDVENPRAFALYRKHGYRIEGRLVDAARIDGAQRDHYWMGLPLTPETEPRWESLDSVFPEKRPELGPVSYRPLRPADAASLQDWERAFLEEVPFLLKQAKEVAPLDQIRTDVAGNAENPLQLSLGAFSGERLLGLASVWLEPWSRSRHDSFVAVNVARQAWGRGIGRHLGAEIEAWAYARGARRLTAAFQAQNLRGARFAEALGFRREVLSPNYVVIEGRSADRVRVAKRLA